MNIFNFISDPLGIHKHREDVEMKARIERLKSESKHFDERLKLEIQREGTKISESAELLNYIINANSKEN